jgi:hypothetical protein
LITSFLLAGDAYGEEEDFKGIWACMTTNAFGYQNGKHIAVLAERTLANRQ